MAVYKTPNGNEIVASASEMQTRYPGGGYTLITPDPSPAASTIITRLAMMNRIGVTAIAQLYSLQSSNTTVAAYLAELQAASFVDLSSLETAGGLNELVTLSVLTSAQVATILTTPVQPSEQP